MDVPVICIVVISSWHHFLPLPHSFSYAEPCASLFQIQRKLQLQIEEQGKYLLQMLENQNKAETDKLKSAPSAGDGIPIPKDNSEISANEAGGSRSPALKRSRTDDSVH